MIGRFCVEDKDAADIHVESSYFYFAADVMRREYVVFMARIFHLLKSASMIWSLPSSLKFVQSGVSSFGGGGL